MQCDIDILGEPSNLAEIELILATTTTLGRLGFKNFKIRINDRQILKAMAAYSGFPEESYDSVFITLDKMDKIGIEGVSEELVKSGFEQACVDKYLELFRAVEGKEGLEGLKVICDMVGDFLPKEVSEGLSEIISSVEGTKTAEFETVFDPTLVRGMSYYTGTIFEVAMPQYGGSCGGGGRYDKMVGKFLGQDTPACGFSIGFERIVMIMMDEGFKIPDESPKCAFLIEKGIGGERLAEIIKEAQKERLEGRQILVVRMNKNKKFQKQQLEGQGYAEFKEFYLNPLS
jgi:histidyl-tRNA synthetase